MSIGSLYLSLKQRFKHGLKAAYYRDIVRLRITDTAPVTGLEEDTCEIHVLTSSDDVLNLMWALKSFYHASERRYPLCIHDDGSLDDEHAAMLQHHFPDARVIDRERADADVLPTLEDYPHAHSFRAENHLAPKLFDFVHYLEGDRMMLLDSDVLFFEEPTELLRRIEDPDYDKNTVNADVDTAYTVSLDDVEEHFGFRPVERFNSGLGLIHADSLRHEWIDEFLQLPNARSHFWRIEQTMFALCSCRYGVELLPEPYNVFLESGVRGPIRHYVGAVRHLMYKEGIARLVRDNFLDAYLRRA